MPVLGGEFSIAMRTIEEITKIVKLTDTIRANEGRFWFTCENTQFNIKEEYAGTDFDEVRSRFLDSSRYPVQVFAHWSCKIGDEVIVRSKRLDPQWMDFETNSDGTNSLQTIKNGLLQELASAILLEQVGALADDEQVDELLDGIYKERGRPEAEVEIFS